VIDFLTYYYKKETTPFLSLSVLPDSEAVPIMEALYMEGSVLWERFKDPGQYLQARRQTEQWLHQEFIVKGGKPQETYPIYMVLGKSMWFSKAADEVTLATTAEIQVPLSIFKEEEVSFTYPDSMLSLLLAYQKDPEYYQPEYHGKLFTLSEICSIVEKNGLPEKGWATNLPTFLPHYIEAQVWNHQSLLAYKRQLEGGKYGHNGEGRA
jgi:hypothetical protein